MTSHEITRGNTLGPMSVGRYWAGRSTQPYARCSCGWVEVAVTADALALTVQRHLDGAKADSHG